MKWLACVPSVAKHGQSKSAWLQQFAEHSGAKMVRANITGHVCMAGRLSQSVHSASW